MIIAKGLSAGEEVVTDGQLRLTPGAQVTTGGGRGDGGRGQRRPRTADRARAASGRRPGRPRPQGLTMNFAETFIRRPVATTLLVLTILIFGIMGYFRLPVADLPTVDYPTSRSTPTCRAPIPTRWPRRWRRRSRSSSRPSPASPSISSRSSQGSTNISLTFDLDRNIDSAAQDVQTAIARTLAQPAAGHADAAVVQQEQPVRLAGAVPDADARTRCRWRRSIATPRRSRAAAVDGHRRRAGQRVRRAEVRRPRRRRSDAAGGAPDRHRPGDAGDQRLQRQPADRHALRADRATSSCSRAAS